MTRPLLAVLIAAAWLLPAPAPAQPGGTLSAELNKLEQAGGACRTYFVFRNGLARDIANLRLDVFLFDTDGVILDRVAIDSEAVGAGRTRVRVFELPGLACADVGEVLMNGVVACEGPEGPIEACAAAVSVSSRAGAGFVD